MNTISCGTDHIISFSYTQIKGSSCREKRKASEDAVWIQTARDYLFCGLADGQSGAEFGAEGGRVCLKAVADYMETAGIRTLLDAPFPDELPYPIVKTFREKLLLLAKKKAVPFQSFASTLLAAAVDLKTGRFLLIHLGDGSAVGIPNLGEPVIISAPDRGLTSCHTWLTTSDCAVFHLRISFGTLENQKRLLLLSDGAACFCRNRDIPWRVKELLKNGSQRELSEYLMQSNPGDDATCIILDYGDRKEEHQEKY